MRLKIFTTGGTIDKVYYDAKDTYEIGDPQIGEVLVRTNVSLTYEVETLFHKDSLELTDDDREVIFERIRNDPHRHVLVTHGTDTMTLTAERLAAVPDKVIVLTGSMQPARFHTSDAIFNIGCAVAAVQLLSPGVYIAMNGLIFEANKVRKNRERRRFERCE